MKFFVKYNRKGVMLNMSFTDYLVSVETLPKKSYFENDKVFQHFHYGGLKIQNISRPRPIKRRLLVCCIIVEARVYSEYSVC